jgi:dTDP-4-dehydrorhamnose reductase
MKKKIWLIGSSGMLGSTIGLLLDSRGIESIVTGREVDITDLKALERFSKTVGPISHIINCAGFTQVDAAEDHREEASRLNVTGVENVAIVSKHLQAKVIHFSTDYVFNGEANKPYREDHPCQPINFYGQTKWEGEKVLFKQKPDACLIRSSWLFGTTSKHFVQTMLRLMAEKEELRLVNDQIGRPTFCEDLADVTLSLLDCSGIYHFANAGETTWYLYAKKIFEEAQKCNFPLKVKKLIPISTSEYPSRAIRPRYSVLNTQKVESELKIAPRSWETTLEDYFTKSFDLTLTH